MVDRCAETIQTLTLESTVDRFKTTVLTREDFESGDMISGQLNEDADIFNDRMFNQLTDINVHGRYSSLPSSSAFSLPPYQFDGVGSGSNKDTK
jgi:hypothetical protein